MIPRLDPVTPGVGTITPVAAERAPATGDVRAGAPRDARLQQAVQNLEGVFVQQLYKAMRESVPQDEGIVSGGTGEEMFTALMDQHLAAETPRHWERGLSEALYRQLSRHLAPVPALDEAVAPSLPDPIRQPDA
ncbi:MAG TPA: rod-binding protein [Gemmatimonadaceae bacterium]|nr:rod-binding protein [Gemmatimonadaceae bacterium]